jgi:branched-chain amino acid transport system substrate-binding protein
VLLALDKIGGDLSDGGAKLRETLASLEFETPTGMVKLDENRNAVADIFLTEVVEGPDGNLLNAVVKVIPAVNQTMGMPKDEFLALGPVGRDNPDCRE